ncbi:MAG: alpha/beta fold hydrolase [Pseudomonadota bacterium]
MSDKKSKTSLETGADLAKAMVSFYSAAFMAPQKAISTSFKIGQEMLLAATGNSEIEPERSDKRWRDPVWKTNPAYRMTMQSYLAWCRGIDTWLEDLDLTERDKLRAKLLTNLVTDTVAPTNTLLGNPTAMKTTLEYGGQNLAKGMKHFIEDMRTNNGLPSMVDKSKFKVGENLAVSEGKVIYQEDHLELLQYLPKSGKSYKTPIFIVPPQINKFYIWDLAPNRSFIEYLTTHGHQVYIVSWRNPTSAQADWGMNSYVEALDRASEVTMSVSKSDSMNVIGACSGGITSAMLIALWTARGDKKRANSFTCLVAILDVEGGKNTTMGLFANLETLELARAFSGRKGVLEGKDLERTFAWLRPNDLIWAYWVNNYLIGNDPPAFDILYWNADTTNLPAALHSDLIGIMEEGGVSGDNRWQIGEYEINLKDITCDTFILGGETDHITPWDGCYLSYHAFGGKSEFVLSQAGHVQSLINPPGNPKARFLTNTGEHSSPEEFVAGAQQNKGSWWPHWIHWMNARAGKQIATPKSYGSNTYEVLGEAPGTYVRAKAQV